MNFLQKIGEDEEKRFFIQKTAILIFVMVFVAAMLLGKPVIGFSLIACAYLFLGYRKLQKYISSKAENKESLS